MIDDHLPVQAHLHSSRGDHVLWEQGFIVPYCILSKLYFLLKGLIILNT